MKLKPLFFFEVRPRLDGKVTLRLTNPAPLTESGQRLGPDWLEWELPAATAAELAKALSVAVFGVAIKEAAESALGTKLTSKKLSRPR